MTTRSYRAEAGTPSLFGDDRLQQLHDVLVGAYGKPDERVCWNPLRQLVYSVLSSRTKTEISDEALYGLEAHFAANAGDLARSSRRASIGGRAGHCGGHIC